MIQKRYWAFGVILVFIDQLTKYHALANLSYIINKGVALSVFSDLDIGEIINILGLVLVVYIWYTISIKNLQGGLDSMYIGLTMITSGGVSNLIDRITQGGVVDFIQIYRFPVFNLADLYIIIGTLIILVSQIYMTNNARKI